MTDEIKVPPLGESVNEATIGTFLKQSGESVKEGDEIVELETEKLNQVLYAPSAGVISWKVKTGDVVKIDQVIGSVAVGEKVAQKAPTPSPQPEKKKAEVKQAEVPKEEEKIVSKTGREVRKKMSKMRKAIAKRLVDSLHQSAMLTTFNEVDMSSVMKLREAKQTEFTQKHGVKLGLTSFFVFAATEALKEFPEINSYIDGDEVVTREYIDIGVAVGGAKGGLVVPVVRECEKKGFAEMEKAIASLAAKAREGKLTVDEITGGGFTITNGGVYGSLLSTPILNPPQIAILGLHKIEKRAVVVDDQIVIRPMMYLALSYDHRLVDGKEAVTFLVRIKELIEAATVRVLT